MARLVAGHEQKSNLMRLGDPDQSKALPCYSHHELEGQEEKGYLLLDGRIFEVDYTPVHARKEYECY